MNLSNDFEVRKETLRALGGDPTGLANIYEVDLEILKLTGGSGSGAASHESVDGVNYLTFVAIEDSTIKMSVIKNNWYFEPGTFEYSKDNAANWNSYTIDTEISLKAGENVKFRGDNPDGLGRFDTLYGYATDYHKFVMTGKIAAYGSIMSLLSPTLNITEITGYGIYGLFDGCNPLIKAPELPATKLTSGHCYYRMFANCTNLAIAPELPALILSQGCYDSMFNNCTSLVESPILPARELADDCYIRLFSGCINLKKITCYSSHGGECSFWHERYYGSGFSKEGTFVKAKGANWSIDSDMTGDNIPYGWNVLEVDVYTEAPMDGKTYGRNNGNWTPVESVEPGIPDAPSDGKQYARQDGNWTPVEEGLTDAPTDGQQYARQDGAWVPVQTPTEGKYMTITADKSNSGETIIHPNIEGSLPNLNLQYRINNGKWSDFIVGTTADIKIGAGDVLQFKGDNKEGVSNNGISGVNSLNFAISGNPVALSGNIMSLIDGVGDTLEIPNNYCFCILFRNSAAIKTVSSDFLPATTLKSSCYRDLFSGCQNLTKAPELPATTLADGCYHGMFYGCKSLVTAPELPAKVLLYGCYGYMFSGCNALNYVKCLATEGTINGDGTVPSALDNWLQGVASTDTFEKLSGVSYEAGGQHGIPEGWTVKEIYDYVEAPLDGQQYARQNGTWTVVESGGSGITDAPSDGKTYGRNNGAWTPVESGYPIKQGVQIDNNVVSVDNYGIYTKLNGNFISYESGNNYVRLYDKLEVMIDGERSEAKFMDVANAGNGVVKTTNNTTLQFWSGTQQEYDAIATKDANTLYVIK